jgi:photosystem II stability/assembly factor-like uncharacterized protein
VKPLRLLKSYTMLQKVNPLRRIGTDIEISLPFTSVWMSPDGIIYAGTTNTVCKSKDKGLNWSELVTIANSAQIRCVFVDERGNVFFSPWGSNVADTDCGLWRSSDKGKTWTRVLELSKHHSVWGMDGESNNVLFVGIYSTADVKTKDEALCSVYRSIDNGLTWFSTFKDPDGRHLHDVKVDRFKNAIYAVYGDDMPPFNKKAIVKSTDGGNSWSSILTNLPQMTCLCATPTSRLFGTDDGSGRIYRTTDDSNTRVVLDANSGFVFWIRRDISTGTIFASVIRYKGKARIFYSNDDGLSWKTLRTLAATTDNDGSQYASNSIAGTFYYSQRLNSTFVNGAKSVFLQ